MALEKPALGHFETPDDVADLLMGFCLRRPADRVLDPGCGLGAILQRAAKWLDWLATTPADLTHEGLIGVELDTQTASKAQLKVPLALVRNQNFFALQATPDYQFEAIIGNPPYTRSQWIGSIDAVIPQQLPLFSWQKQKIIYM